MGLDIIIPVVLIVVIVPTAAIWAKKKFKDGARGDVDEPVVAPSDRLTSGALRDLASPPWRVVYEIAPGKLNGIGHVLIGPAGAFAVQTSMEPLPIAPGDDVDAKTIGQAAIARGGVDDALRRCAMSSDRLVVVHWGVNDDDTLSIEPMPGVTAVDGRRLGEWANGLGADALAPAQVDLAWQTVVTAIGRPDPLA